MICLKLAYSGQGWRQKLPDKGAGASGRGAKMTEKWCFRALFTYFAKFPPTRNQNFLRRGGCSPLARERRRRGRGNGHSIDFRCMMQNLKTRLRLMAICESRESHINGCEEREKSPKFSQLPSPPLAPPLTVDTSIGVEDLQESLRSRGTFETLQNF